MTIGIVLVACFAAKAAGVVWTTMASTLRATNSPAKLRGEQPTADRAVSAE